MNRFSSDTVSIVRALEVNSICLHYVELFFIIFVYVVVAYVLIFALWHL